MSRCWRLLVTLNRDVLGSGRPWCAFLLLACLVGCVWLSFPDPGLALWVWVRCLCLLSRCRLRASRGWFWVLLSLSCCRGSGLASGCAPACCLSGSSSFPWFCWDLKLHCPVSGFAKSLDPSPHKHASDCTLPGLFCSRSVSHGILSSNSVTID